MTKEKKSKFLIDGKPINVKIKRLTFYDIQGVAHLMTHGTLDFSSYWQHAFTHWIRYFDKEGQAVEIDVEHLSPDEGNQLAELLPDPNQIIDWLVFRSAKLATLSNSSTVGLLSTDFATNEKGWSTF
jgi:hypothetical protein